MKIITIENCTLSFRGDESPGAGTPREQAEAVQHIVNRALAEEFAILAPALMVGIPMKVIEETLP